MFKIAYFYKNDNIIFFWVELFSPTLYIKLVSLNCAGKQREIRNVFGQIIFNFCSFCQTTFTVAPSSPITKYVMKICLIAPFYFWLEVLE